MGSPYFSEMMFIIYLNTFITLNVFTNYSYIKLLNFCSLQIIFKLLLIIY